MLAMLASSACGDEAGSQLFRAPDDPVEAPAELDFGPVLIGSSRTFAIDVRNPNGAAVRVDEARVRGADADDFTFSPELTAFEAGEVVRVEVAFVPRGPSRGDRFAELVVGLGPYETAVALQGFAIDVTFTVEPESVDFGRLVPGSIRSARLIVANTTETPSTFRAELSPGSPFSLRREDLTLDGFESGELRVDFEAPPDPVTPLQSETLRIRATGLASDGARVALRGESAAPPLDCPEVVVLEPGRRSGIIECFNGTLQDVRVAVVEVAADDRARWEVGAVSPRLLPPSDRLIVPFGYIGEVSRRSEGVVLVFARNPETPNLNLAPIEVAVTTSTAA